MGKVVIYLRESDERYLRDEGEDPAQWARGVIARAFEAKRGITYTEHPEQVLAWMLGAPIPERGMSMAITSSTPFDGGGQPPDVLRSELDALDLRVLILEQRINDLEEKDVPYEDQ